MLESLLLGAVAVAGLGGLPTAAPPEDTPLEPVSVAVVEAARLLDGEMSPGLCERFGETADLLAVFVAAEPSAAGQLTEMAISYWVDDFEDTLGANQALSPEAEEAYEAWVASCMA